MKFVLDASITLSWLLQDSSERDTGYSVDVLNALRAPETTAHVPVTWALEIANVVARSEAKNQVTAAQSESFLALLEALSIEADTDTFAQALANTLELARRYRLSSYDASYLELALRGGLSIATFDDDLRRAAVKAGVELFSP